MVVETWWFGDVWHTVGLEISHLLMTQWLSLVTSRCCEIFYDLVRRYWASLILTIPSRIMIPSIRLGTQKCGSCTMSLKGSTYLQSQRIWIWMIICSKSWIWKWEKDTFLVNVTWWRNCPKNGTIFQKSAQNLWWRQLQEDYKPWWKQIDSILNY